MTSSPFQVCLEMRQRDSCTEQSFTECTTKRLKIWRGCSELDLLSINEGQFRFHFNYRYALVNFSFLLPLDMYQLVLLSFYFVIRTVQFHFFTTWLALVNLALFLSYWFTPVPLTLYTCIRAYNENYTQIDVLSNLNVSPGK